MHTLNTSSGSANSNTLARTQAPNQPTATARRTHQITCQEFHCFFFVPAQYAQSIAYCFGLIVSTESNSVMQQKQQQKKNIQPILHFYKGFFMLIFFCFVFGFFPFAYRRLESTSFFVASDVELLLLLGLSV